MPRPGTIPPLDLTARVQRALNIRCRRGEPEALAALLYSLVDRLYTAASYVLPDETTAVNTVAETWHDLLEMLRTPALGRPLTQRALALLEQRLEVHVPAPEVRRALQRAAGEDDDGLISFPAPDLQALVEAIPGEAAAIAERSRRRQLRLRNYLISGTVFLTLVVGHNVWQQSLGRNRASMLKLKSLQEQVRHHDLPTALRDYVDELPDPEGANRYEARLLQRINLVLEELANSQAETEAQALTLLARRVSRERLHEELNELLAIRADTARRELREVQLVVEEVANL